MTKDLRVICDLCLSDGHEWCERPVGVDCWCPYCWDDEEEE